VKHTPKRARVLRLTLCVSATRLRHPDLLSVIDDSSPMAPSFILAQAFCHPHALINIYMSASINLVNTLIVLSKP
jgi:hypothetical protein